jgi:hypothetical protein
MGIMDGGEMIVKQKLDYTLSCQSLKNKVTGKASSKEQFSLGMVTQAYNSNTWRLTQEDREFKTCLG